VLLADDHPLGRQGARYFLEESGVITIVGEADNGEEAARLIEQLAPDVALLDLHMPGIGGIEVARWAREQGYTTRVVILTADDDPRFVQAALEGGARGYLLKDIEPEVMVEAVMAVSRGEMAYDPLLLAGWKLPATDLNPPPDARLSGRELDVLRGIMSGQPDKIIARNLGISDGTVASHVTNVFKKLRATNRTQAVIRAMALGLVQTMPLSGDSQR